MSATPCPSMTLVSVHLSFSPHLGPRTLVTQQVGEAFPSGELCTAMPMVTFSLLYKMHRLLPLISIPHHSPQDLLSVS
ncbi:putative membrane-bound O-acyltransferase C24H6.01c [Fusarium oxysporum f. sp. albedinis]|nr:putative membrane-bound O-acyltransferase C24H6.01c [Fusarium oxysporum f. sp. albedinis]